MAFWTYHQDRMSREHTHERFELKSKSSCQLYFFESENNKLVLKTPNMTLSELSPFWKQLRHIFKSDFITQTENVYSLVKFLRGNPHIRIPKVIYTNTEDRIFQIFEFIEGSSYGPDEFPSIAGISYQLGQYIGWIHSHRFQGYGIFSEDLQLKRSSHLLEETLDSMESIIHEYCNSNQEVINYYNNIKNIIPAELGFFSLIMPDISGNQFVYSRDLGRINAVVDIDSYVIGPINLELTVIEMCLKDYFSFRTGYEQYCILPCFKYFRSFYRFFLYLNDPYNPIGLEDFFNSNIFFS